MEYLDETIAPPKYWLMFTPYAIAEFDETAMDFFFRNAYVIYKEHCYIWLSEWKEKYALRHVIKELMEERNV
jgi:hypothetical protein